jgi:hypothetical protein
MEIRDNMFQVSYLDKVVCEKLSDDISYLLSMLHQFGSIMLECLLRARFWILSTCMSIFVQFLDAFPCGSRDVYLDPKYLN